MDRRTHADDIAAILRNAPERNDYTDTFQRLIGDLGPQEEFLALVQDIYASVKDEKDYRILNFPESGAAHVKRALFMLFAVGAIDNWSFFDQKEDAFSVLVNVQKEQRTLQDCKERARQYLHLLGCTQRTLNTVSRAQRIEDVVSAYVGWYYERFVSRHKEEFQDMLALFERFAVLPDSAQRDWEINQRLEAYFSLSMMEISQDEEKYTHISFKEIASELLEKNDRKMAENIQQINQSHTHVRLDFYLFAYSVLYDEEYDQSRLTRLLGHCERSDFFDLAEAAAVLYSRLNAEDCWRLFEDLSDFGAKHEEAFEVLFDAVYRSNPKDWLYYGVAARYLNTCFA